MARVEEVTFERITRVYRDENSKKALTPLEVDFWDKVAQYVEGLRRDVAAQRAKDPHAKATMLLEDELRKVEQKRAQIHEYRERKIAALAISKARGAELETRGLARPEQELLAQLVAAFTAARESAAGSAVPSVAAKTVEGDVTPAAPTPHPTSGSVLVRILEDMPPFAGVDRTYRLSKEDVVSLPPQIAKVLLDRGKAARIEPSA